MAAWAMHGPYSLGRLQVHKVLPYETHFVWVSGNNWGKIHRMREQMYYKDPDSYYMGTDYVSIDLDTVEVRERRTLGASIHGRHGGRLGMQLLAWAGQGRAERSYSYMGPGRGAPQACRRASHGACAHAPVPACRMHASGLCLPASCSCSSPHATHGQRSACINAKQAAGQACGSPWSEHA